MTQRRWWYAVAAGLVTVAGCTGDDVAGPATTTGPNGVRPGGPGRSVGLRAFGSCDELADTARALALDALDDGSFFPGWPVDVAYSAIPAAGGAAESARDAAAPTATTTGGSSQTNVQEAGVDEGDAVEVDGALVYTVVDGALRIVDTASSRVLATEQLPEGSHQLVLAAGTLVVVTASWGWAGGPSPVARGDVMIEPWGGVGETVVSVYDVSAPAQAGLVGRWSLDGGVVAVRRPDDRVRLVLQSQPGSHLDFVYPTRPDSVEEAEAHNRAVIAASDAGDWLPTITDELGAGSAGVALDCSDVDRPAAGATLSMLWVATVGLTDPGAPVEGAAGAFGVAGTTYASARTLYVAGPTPSEADDGLAPVRPPEPSTTVHAFALDTDDGARYVASGQVPGYLGDQWSMSEHDGVLRVVTTESDRGRSSSSVTTLRRDGDSLARLGHVGGLGRDEQVYAVRFVGELGFVVTFRRTDPLWVVDLADPAAPAVVGELHVPGYSDYLHPVAPGVLLGIGQDADPDTGRVRGLQMALFDVADPANPFRLDALSLGGQSEAEYDHLAFTWWEPTATALVPRQDWSALDRATGLPATGAVAVRVDGDRLVEAGELAQPGGAGEPVRRVVVAAGRYVTVSGAGVGVFDTATLDRVGWVPFGA